MITANRVRKAISVASGIATGVGNGLRQSPVVLVDIGGRGGLSKPWQLLWRAGLVRPVFFEPDPAAAKQLEARHSTRATIIPKAAWSSEATRSLHITAEPGGSSILTPSPDSRMSQQMKDLLKIERELAVELVTAKSALGDAGVVPEIVKIDVQGGELEVLRGFGNLLNSVTCCELEVSFMRGYRDQPLFNEIFDFMIDSGFGLFDLKVFGVAGTRSGVQANAYFCRRSIESKRQRAIESLFCRASDFTYWP